MGVALPIITITSRNVVFLQPHDPRFTHTHAYTGRVTSTNGDTGTGTSGAGVGFGPQLSVSPLLNPFEPLDQCLVPSSTSLAHLAAITGGWFYTLQSLRAAIEDGRRGRAVRTLETRLGAGVGSRATVSSVTSVGVFGGVGESDGPSVALCQVQWVWT